MATQVLVFCRCLTDRYAFVEFIFYTLQLLPIRSTQIIKFYNPQQPVHHKQARKHNLVIINLTPFSLSIVIRFPQEPLLSCCMNRIRIYSFPWSTLPWNSAVTSLIKLSMNTSTRRPSCTLTEFAETRESEWDSYCSSGEAGLGRAHSGLREDRLRPDLR